MSGFGFVYGVQMTRKDAKSILDTLEELEELDDLSVITDLPEIHDGMLMSAMYNCDDDQVILGYAFSNNAADCFETIIPFDVQPKCNRSRLEQNINEVLVTAKYSKKVVPQLYLVKTYW